MILISNQIKSMIDNNIKMSLSRLCQPCMSLISYTLVKSLDSIVRYRINIDQLLPKVDIKIDVIKRTIKTWGNKFYDIKADSVQETVKKFIIIQVITIFKLIDNINIHLIFLDFVILHPKGLILKLKIRLNILWVYKNRR